VMALTSASWVSATPEVQPESEHGGVRQPVNYPRPERSESTRRAPRSTCKCCETLATDCSVSPASESTFRGPWARRSSISSRFSLARACPDTGELCVDAVFEWPVAHGGSIAPLRGFVKPSIDHLTIPSCRLDTGGYSRVRLTTCQWKGVIFLTTEDLDVTANAILHVPGASCAILTRRSRKVWRELAPVKS